MSPDLLRRLADPLLAPLRAACEAAPLPGAIQAALAQAFDASGLLLLAALLIGLGPRLAAPERGWRAALAPALLAAGLGAWLLTHPSERFDDLFLRWDHFAFAAAAGSAAGALPGGARKSVLAALSAALLILYLGPLPLAVLAGLTGAGLAVARTPAGRDARSAALLHAGLLLAVYAGAFWLRSHDLAAAARLQGLLAFGVLRYISLMVANFGAAPPSLTNCALYMTCYPGIAGMRGAPEVYDEFARRNLVRPVALDQRAAGRSMARGVGLLVASAAVPMTLARIVASTSALEAWICAIIFFIKTACAAMGLWRTVDATALCLGIRLRMNFAGLLTCRNPSELWWAWRGTMTNWLVQYVYAPLGANRHHQSRNILAAFAVSLAWHALGVPFLVPNFRWVHVLPVALWAVLNGLGVVAHVNAQRRLRAAGAPARPGRLRLGLEIVGMWAFGSMTPILLSYQGPAVAGLPQLLRLLLGLGG